MMQNKKTLTKKINPRIFSLFDNNANIFQNFSWILKKTFTPFRHLKVTEDRSYKNTLKKKIIPVLIMHERL